MREVDAICAALAEMLPQRHPELFGGILGVAYLNFSAYSVRRGDTVAVAGRRSV